MSKASRLGPTAFDILLKRRDRRETRREFFQPSSAAADRCIRKIACKTVPVAVPPAFREKRNKTNQCEIFMICGNKHSIICGEIRRIGSFKHYHREHGCLKDTFRHNSWLSSARLSHNIKSFEGSPFYFYFSLSLVQQQLIRVVTQSLPKLVTILVDFLM